jgi:hypothetical protein
MRLCNRIGRRKAGTFYLVFNEHRKGDNGPSPGTQRPGSGTPFRMFPCEASAIVAKPLANAIGIPKKNETADRAGSGRVKWLIWKGLDSSHRGSAPREDGAVPLEAP